MAEEVAPVAVTPEAVVAAPAVEATPVVPIVETSAAVAEVTPSAEPAVEVPKPLLSAEPAEVKPADTEVVPESPKADAESAPLPIYEFKLPENAQKDNPVFQAFTEKLGDFQKLHNVSHEAVQKFGQDMIDIQVQNVKDIAENQNKLAWDWFKNRNTQWLESAQKDPVIGNDNWDGTVSSAQQAISLYGGNKAQQLETAKLFQETGVENHPALLRFLSNITKVAAKEGSPVSSQSASAQKPGIAQAMFGGSTKAS